MNNSERWKRILALEGDDRLKGISREHQLEQVLDEGLKKLIEDHGIVNVTKAAAKYGEERAEVIQIECPDELEPRAEAWKKTAAALDQAVETMPK